MCFFFGVTSVILGVVNKNRAQNPSRCGPIPVNWFGSEVSDNKSRAKAGRSGSQPGWDQLPFLPARISELRQGPPINLQG